MDLVVSIKSIDTKGRERRKREKRGKEERERERERDDYSGVCTFRRYMYANYHVSFFLLQLTVRALT